MRRTSMLRPIINVLLVSALLTVGLTATVALAAPGIEGCSGHHETVGDVPIKEGGVPIEECQTGPPDEDTAPAEGFGAVTSQRASTVHDIGEHSSDQVEPRKGVGNVARTDANLADLIDGPGGVEETGARVGDHGCLIGELDDAFNQDPNGVTSCTDDPGNPDKPGKGRS